MSTHRHQALAPARPRAAEAGARRSAFAKLDPRVQWRNPVMFVVYVGSILTTLLWLAGAAAASGEAPAGFILAVALWLWFTVLFANFAEALAEGRSKAQAASLRGLKKSTWAKKLEQPHGARCHGGTWLPLRGEQPAQGRRGAGRGRRHRPAGRRGDRRRRLRGRERHHRRIGAGGARVGRRLLRGHRRHARAVRLARGAHHASTRASPSSTA